MPVDLKLTRTYVLPAVTRHAKNLENCATYTIRQVLLGMRQTTARSASGARALPVLIDLRETWCSSRFRPNHETNLQG